MSAQFFFDRLQRANCMDSTNKELGRDMLYLREAVEWLDAYKQTLSKNQLDKFEKEWKKAEQELASARKFADFGKK